MNGRNYYGLLIEFGRLTKRDTDKQNKRDLIYSISPKLDREGLIFPAGLVN